MIARWNLAVLILLVVSWPAEASEQLKPRIRRPVAIVANDELVAVANSRSGAISVFEGNSKKILGEHHIAASITDMRAIRSPKPRNDLAAFALCPDEKQLVRLQLTDSSIEKQVVSAIDPSAIRLAVDQRAKRLFVSCRWTHQVTVLAFDRNFKNVTSSKSIKLPFAPREMLVLPNKQVLLVAAAFGNQIAIVDTESAATAQVVRIEGHNIRGLAISNDRDRVLIAHQSLNPLARADFDDLHWGMLVSNGVRVIETNLITDGSDDPQPLKSWLDRMGRTGNATGDPAGVITGEKDLMAVALGGVGEVLVRRAGYLTRLRVGRGPEAMAVAGDRLYVANRFDDTISVIDLDVGKLIRTVPLGPTGPLTAVDRGERLFFDAKLSHDGWMSCHSCHTDGHSSGLLVDTLGDGDYGAPKRVPSLLGTQGTGPWAWSGAMNTLAAQVKKSVSTTMHGDELTEQQTSDLVAFLESLSPPPPRETISDKLINAGRAVFEANRCNRCHTAGKFTSNGVFDVGILDEHKNNKFNPPSLIGVSQRGRLFHDGRANGIEDVVRRYQHMLDRDLSAEDVRSLLAFLRSL